jgi:hypothetical protein
MKFFGNGGIGYGIAIGIGAALLVPVLAKFLSSVGKPLLKESIKGGLILLEKSKVAAAEMKEIVEDITAEAKAEMASSQKATPVAAGKKAAAK